MARIAVGSYSVDPDTGTVFGKRGYPITAVGGGGYVVVRCHAKHVGYAHRFVWEAVYGPVPEGLQINHINGIKTDNRITNLEAVTSSENNAHAFRLGLNSKAGERNPSAKLTRADVEAIRSSDELQKVLAGRYGVSPSTISLALSEKTWPTR